MFNAPKFSQYIRYGALAARVLARKQRSLPKNGQKRTVHLKTLPPVLSDFNKLRQLSTDRTHERKLIDPIEELENLTKNSYISPHEKLKKLAETWKSLIENLAILEEKHFLMKLNCYLNCRAKIVPKDFMNEVKTAGLDLSENILKLLLKVVAEHGDPGYVSSVVTSMKSRNYPADDSVFASIVVAHAVRGDMASARHVLTTMEECKVEPGPETFTAVMRAAAMNGDYASLHTYRTMAVEKKLNLSSENILKVLESAARSRKEHLIPSLKNSLDICTVDEIYDLAVRLSYSGFPTAGYSILKLVKDDLSSKCQAYLEIICVTATPAQSIEVGKMMTIDETYDRALYDVIKHIMQQEKFEEALAGLKVCKEIGLPIRPHFFWPVIITAYKNKGEKGIYDILNAMTVMEVTPDRDTWLDVVLPRVTIDAENVVLKRLQDSGGFALSAVLSPYLCALVRAGNLKQATELANKYKDSLSNNYIEDMIESLLYGYRTSRDHVNACKILDLLKVKHVTEWLVSLFLTPFWITSDDFRALFKELHKTGCFITLPEERRILNVVKRNKSVPPEIQALIKNLVRVNLSGLQETNEVELSKNELEELEYHLKELEAKGMNTRGVLRKLLLVGCQTGNVQKAQEAYKKLMDLGVNLSPGILAAMIQVNVKANQVDEAVEFFRKLQREFPEFRLDAYKIIDLATLLVRFGKFNDALDLIRNNPCRRQDLKVSSDWERNCWEFLSECSDKEGVRHVKDALLALLDHNFTRPTNVVLGPMIKAYLNSGDIDGAVTEFERCAKQYKATPLHQEVLYAAFSSNNPDLVEKVVNAATSIHGLENTQSIVVGVLANKNDVETLHNLLKEGSFNLNSQRIVNQIERMKTLGQIDALKTLVEASRGTEFNPDSVISSVLYIYNRRGDIEGALQWWSFLESAGFKLSDDHRTSLANLVATGANAG